MRFCIIASFNAGFYRVFLCKIIIAQWCHLAELGTIDSACVGAVETLGVRLSRFSDEYIIFDLLNPEVFEMS